ncbi:hypothetical protein [Methyloversatilis thermotolerans]|nr:hypothetical protein [Methyloversatilis thermotolerans]
MFNRMLIANRGAWQRGRAANISFRLTRAACGIDLAGEARHV